MAGSKIYMCWNDLRARCDNPNNSSYHRYGGRGISYDPRWKSFDNFLADVGFSPSPHHSLDRIDNNGNYTKENCRWATKWEQDNNKSNNHRVLFYGHSLTIAQLAREFGICQMSLRNYLVRGEFPEDAVRLVMTHKRAKVFEYGGKMLKISQIAKAANVYERTLRHYLLRGVGVLDAIAKTKEIDAAKKRERLAAPEACA